MPELHGYRLYAMDLPGFGLTDPIGYQTSTMRSTVVKFLAQTLDGLGIERSQFVTNSQGSLWTTWLAFDEPERVDAHVQIGCPAQILGTTAPLPMRVVSIPVVGRLLLGLQSPSRRQVERVFATVHEDVTGIPEVRDVLLACERLPAYARSVSALMSAVMCFGRARSEIVLSEDQLRWVRHPVQMIWGDQDPFGSVSVARRVAEFLPDAELHVVPGGHAPWLRHTGTIGALVRPFLYNHRDCG